MRPGIFGLLFLAFGVFAAQPQRQVMMSGMCDASATVWLGEGTVAIADDEDNVLRIYSTSGDSQPIWQQDFSRFLKVDPDSPEADLEGAARVGDRVYWISSHGRNAKGKKRSSRMQFFATQVAVTNHALALVPIGLPCHTLLRDLIGDARFNRFQLASASQLAPKESGALNIEGLAAGPDGQLLIGFRNPVPQGKALIIPLLNPAQVIETGSPARFGDPIQLDLGGLGIRSLTRHGDRYILVAGGYDAGGKSKLLEWLPGQSTAQPLGDLPLGALNPEAISVSQTGPATIFLTSDDGSVETGGKACKKLKDPRQKTFRAALIPLQP